ncbi:MAG: hypothetical protein Q7S47_01820 [bacterium]|nr:hypothetical protein [bacterium]
MKIDITKEQFRDLIVMSGIANSVLGVLGDSLPDTNYKERSNRMEELEEYFLRHATDFDSEKFTQDHDGKKIFDDEMYEKHILPIMEDYDEHQLVDGLANTLAWRDFRSEHSEVEMKEMEKKNGGYFGVALYDYEKKYWDEFEEHGFERLEIVGEKKKI